MFFVLSESSLAGIHLEVVCGVCETDLHTFHGTTLLKLPPFYHTVLKIRTALEPSHMIAQGKCLHSAFLQSF